MGLKISPFTTFCEFIFLFSTLKAQSSDLSQMIPQGLYYQTIACSIKVEPALCAFPPLHEVFYPDWIKWAGVPENVFSLLLHVQGEEGHGLPTKHFITVITVGI